ncbi:MAG: hypothetical protein M0Z27_00185 [Thermaerobacter sp.]|nr:hypothetical protein [Thermaerobacter sp.]
MKRGATASLTVAAILLALLAGCGQAAPRTKAPAAVPAAAGTPSASLPVSSFPLPTRGATPRFLALGAAGSVWALAGSTLWEYAPVKGGWRSFPLPGRTVAMAAYGPGGLWLDQPGNAAGQLVQWSPAGTAIATWPASAGGSRVGGLAVDPAGNAWISAASRGGLLPHLREVTLAGKVSVYPLAGVHGPPGGVAAAATQVWVALAGAYDPATGAYTGAGIARVTPATGKVKLFRLPWSGYSPRRLVLDPSGNLWFTCRTRPGGRYGWSGTLFELSAAGSFSRHTLAAPPGHPAWTGALRALAVGAKGEVWAYDVNYAGTTARLAELTPAGTLTYSAPFGPAPRPALRVDQKGRVWFLKAGGLGRL